MWFDEDMPDRLYQWLLKQTPERHIEILGEALDLMQQYNGRTRLYCVLTAAGFKENYNDETGKTTWAFPKEEPKPEPQILKRHTRWPNPIKWGKGHILCPKLTSITAVRSLRDFKKLHEWSGRCVAYLEGN